MIITGSTTTEPTITPAASVANALRTVTRAAALIPADLVLVDSTAVRIVAPNVITAARWQDRFPTGHVEAGDRSLPLHVAVEGDVEGGAA